MVCILMSSVSIAQNEKAVPHKEISLCGFFVFCMLFNGGTVPWYITMKSYHLMDSIFRLVLGTGLQVFNVNPCSALFKNLPVELEEACFMDGADPGEI